MAWINRVTSSPFPELRRSAEAVYGDFDAVRSGFALQWSSGEVKGNVTRLKMLKAQITAGPTRPSADAFCNPPNRHRTDSKGQPYDADMEPARRSRSLTV